MVDTTLGAGENRCYIYDRQGQTRLLELPSAGISYSRVLSDISRPTVSIAPAQCTSDMDRVHAWAHSLVIYRNGDRVWEGPIRKIRDSKDGKTIVASDVIGWTERRAQRAARVLTGTPVRDEMAWTISAAFTPDDPNILTWMQALGGPPTALVDRDLSPGGYHSEDLANLVSAGGRYTALGRSILIWEESTIIGRTVTLVPENHMLSDVAINEDGDDLTTGAFSRDDEGGSTYRPLTGEVSDFYGLVETVISAGSGTHSEDSLAQYANAALNIGYPAPLTIELPTDSTLQCDAPFPFAQLVPGVLVPVETTTATSRRVSATMVLAGVTVTQNAGQPEKVSISLAPVSGAAV